MRYSLRITLSLLMLLSSLLASGRAFAADPNNPPDTSTAPYGGYFRAYFMNIIVGDGPCLSNQFVTGFDSSLPTTDAQYGKKQCGIFDEYFKTYVKVAVKQQSGKILAGFDETTGNGVFVDAYPTQWGNTGSSIFFTGANVGIGTNNPMTKLHVVKQGIGETARFESDGDTYISFYSGSSSNPSNRVGYLSTAQNRMILVTEKNAPLDLGASGSIGIRLTAAGKVGIGTTSPADRFTVVSGGEEGFTWDSGNNADLRIYRDNNLGNWTNLRSNNGSGIVIIGAADVPGVAVARAGTGASFVGIGNLDPKARLHVISVTADEVGRFQSSGNPYLSLYRDGARTSFWYSRGADTHLINQSSGYLGFGSNNTYDQLIINGSGNVGIGTITPTAKLQIRNGTTTAGGYTKSLSLHADHPSMQFKGISNTNHSAFIGYDAQNTQEGLKFWVNGSTDDMADATQALTIRSSGNIGIGTANPGAKLDVAGTVKISGGGPLAGEFLKSIDNAGNASWEPILYTESDPKVGNLTTNTIPMWGGSSLVNTRLTVNNHTFNFQGLGSSGSLIDIRTSSGDVADSAIRFHRSDIMWYTMGLDASDGQKFKIGIGGTLGNNDNFVMNAAGDIGIGTNNPVTKFEISSNRDNPLRLNKTGTGFNYMEFAENGTRMARFGRALNNTFVFRSDDVNQDFYFENFRNVGIGTNSPSTTLDVRNTTLNSQLHLSNSGRPGVGMYFLGLDLGASNNDWNGGYISANSAFEGGAWKAKKTGGTSVMSLTDSGVRFFTSTGSIAGSTIDYVPLERMVITSIGNVGIGTISPAKSLHVSSSGSDEVARFEGIGRNPYISLYKDGVRRAYLSSSASNAVGLINTQNADLNLGTNNATKMTIDASGSIGIGTTAPQVLLHVKSTNGEVARFETSSNPFITLYSGNEQRVYLSSSATKAVSLTNVQNADLNLGTNGNTKMAIKAGGDVGIGTTSPSAKLHVAGTARMEGTVRMDGGLRLDFGSPSNGKFLKATDSNGNTTWANISGTLPDGSNNGETLHWDNSGNAWIIDRNIYNNGTNVGIGTSSPTQKLDVNGQIRIRTGNPGAGKVLTALDNNGNATWSGVSATVESDPQVGANTLNYLSKWDNNALVKSSVYDNGANVGIGTNAPTTLLDVRNTTLDSQLHLSNSGTTGMYLMGLDGNAGWDGGYISANSAFEGGVWTSKKNGNTSVMSLTDSGIRFFASTGSIAGSPIDYNQYERMIITSSGNIGIGTRTPTQKLDVAGTGKFTGLQLPTGAGANKVLISDASGNATWSGVTFGSGGGGAVTSVFGRTGAVVAGSSDYTTTQIAEGTNAYFTDARARNAITGGASTITSTDLTQNKALISTAGGKVGVSPVSSTELGYLAGVSSAVQTQIDTKASLASPILTGNPTSSALLLITDNDTSLATTAFVKAQNYVTSTTGTNYLSKWNGSSFINSLLFDDGSSVGIGTATPTVGKKLEVAGDTKISGNIQIIGGTPAAGEYLKTDANGNATWEPLPPSGGGNQVYDFVRGKFCTTDDDTIAVLNPDLVSWSAPNIRCNGGNSTTGYSSSLAGTVPLASYNGILDPFASDYGNFFAKFGTPVAVKVNINYSDGDLIGDTAGNPRTTSFTFGPGLQYPFETTHRVVMRASNRWLDIRVFLLNNKVNIEITGDYSGGGGTNQFQGDYVVYYSDSLASSYNDTSNSTVVYGIHLYSECTTAGGTLVSIPTGGTVCQLPATNGANDSISCPAGWNVFKDPNNTNKPWITTKVTTCPPTNDLMSGQSCNGGMPTANGCTTSIDPPNLISPKNRESCIYDNILKGENLYNQVFACDNTENLACLSDAATVGCY